MDFTPPGTRTLIPHAAFLGFPLSLGVVDDAGKVVVGGGRSTGWGGAMTETVSHLDTIGVGYGGRKEDEIVLDTEEETQKEKDAGGKFCHERSVSRHARSDG
ncbi:hypothetical protein BJ165DRAFT_1410782 [Panaeolus papilionaceus]|nr:hypothetical protein BJ165DRAFT_1410782 [Panaeolus papilionaceus]